ncbi:putative tricarboxylic transport membrane protein [Cytobacillus horneckiae]|uniref:Tripartite tricarboxylate transporter TctB family protein n=2 Tax=Cytobacillus horneckiae TaxID=549687 RepID=A0A2N0ZCJ4_9BACI|nr:tripartite tricarboxylate transporter TctB family protein [Cytobacillus horneckiae]MBN6885423.1 tripartite tricarboxylate transporter TctB family protein [Cytobacillus horneckiae]MCM3178852.1 tripartite tricarboxylate transporter TctB family protein [Cytobacillus horneckiae]MEC1158842.1 tripartite tricarboxylate transporter TctB family protein [Cytobacillus horneckiae]MED2937262.1 tripartite tricarboxylate transporter TctB family protein [Cytobacillus horneckiae]PKG27236.1 tripartite tricar
MDIKFDRCAAVVFLAVGLLSVIGSRGIASSSYGSVVGPDIFPLFLGILLMILAIRLFYETFQVSRSAGKKEKLRYKPFFIIFIATLLYILTLETIGYVITTFVFLFICFQTMEKGKWVTSLIISAGFSGVIYFLFVNVLKGTLPGWPIWFS